MGKKVLIDGIEFDEKVDGMTLVDAYYIPDEDVEQYRKDREFVAEKVTAIFKTFCHDVRRDYAGSQDGEAIVGNEPSGDCIAFAHLDPDTVEELMAAEHAGEFEKVLREIC